MKMSKTTFSPFSEKQLKVLNWWCPNNPLSSHDAIICDGAVRSGKTLCMSISFISWAMFSFNDTAFALCGKTITSLRRNVITEMLPIMTELGFKCTDKTSKNIIEISKGKVKNRFYIFGGKDEASASLIQGMTLGGVFFDEVALMPQSFVEQALARCSLKNSKFWFNCNPDNPYHWFNQNWILKCSEKNSLHLHFTMKDNPSLSEEIIKRYESLYTGHFYTRFIEGKWVMGQGLIYDFFDEEKHTCILPETFEKYYISCDYGTVNPTSMGFWGKNKNVWYRIKEYYFDSRKEKYQHTDEEYYSELEALAQGFDVSAVIVDPSAASFIECIHRHGKFTAIPAKNQVLDGIRMVSDCIKNGKIKFSKECNDALREFHLYSWDEGSCKDSPKKENDHAMDDIRYFVSTVVCKENEENLFAIAIEREQEWQ
ncbi:MAG: PBSX family phage terminase large subunit [Clostridiales bacterium]|nr:PBSX family phage terminase large subunit [Clostridiales bacterium]